jgi:hypothetical protein
MFVWRLEKQKQILRLTTPKLKKTLGAPFAQDDTLANRCLATPEEREKQMQILRLTTPKLKKTLGAPFAQDDTLSVSGMYCKSESI